MRQFLLISLFTICAAAKGQVIFADYSDPDVCVGRDGELWMTASSFQCCPGLPLLSSRDGQDWTLAAYALKALVPAGHYDTVRHGCGVWAPSIRFHNDTYYIYWGDPDYGILMTKSHDPRDGWSEPVMVVEGKGLIDPCPLWDDDGRCYLVNAWASSRCGFNSILTVRELTADGTKALGLPRMVYDGQVAGNHTVEGPKLYRRDGWYYILAPAGGVEKGWQLALRSRNVFGPYETKVVFHRDGIHQGGWVGDDFFAFQDRGAYGRVVHRLKVSMNDGWPMMRYEAAIDKPKSVGGAPQYQWHANYQEVFGFETAEGTRVYGHSTDGSFRNLWEVPNLYLRKFDGECFSDTLRLRVTATDSSQESGFVIMGRDYMRLSLRLDGGQFILSRIECHDADNGGTEAEERLTAVTARRYNAGALDNYECMVWVRMECSKGALCRIAFSTDNRRYTDLSAPFQARVGKWIGAKYGVFSISSGKQRGWVELIRN